MSQIGFDRRYQCGLRLVLPLKGFQNVLVNGTVGDDVHDHYGIGGLTLPPQPCVRLTVKLKTPRHAEPHDGAAAALKVQPVSCGCRVNKGNGKLTVVPSADTVGTVHP